jgi:DNA-binding NarL/FixJ family response regulator
MIISASKLEKSVGRFNQRFLLACLSTGFKPTVVYASGSQAKLASYYRGMAFTRGDCLGACTKGASTLELIAQTKPSIVVMHDDLPDLTVESLAKQAKYIHPKIRTFAIIDKLDQFTGDAANSVVVADQDLLSHVETHSLASMAIVTNTSYQSPSILKRLDDLSQEAPADFKGVYHLIHRERQLLEAYALGLSNKETAELLGLSVRTVQTYSTNLLQKLGVNNRQKALRQAVKLGFSFMGKLF